MIIPERELSSSAEYLLEKQRVCVNRGYRFLRPEIYHVRENAVKGLRCELERELKQRGAVGWRVIAKPDSDISESERTYTIILDATNNSTDILTPGQIEYFQTQIPVIVHEILDQQIDCLLFLDKSAREFNAMIRRAWSSPSHFPTTRFANLGLEKMHLIEAYILNNQERLRKKCPASELYVFDELINHFFAAQTEEGDGDMQRKLGTRSLMRILEHLLDLNDYMAIFGAENLAKFQAILQSFNGQKVMIIDDTVTSGSTAVLTRHLISLVASPQSVVFRTIFHKTEEVFKDHPQKQTVAYTPWSKSGSFDEKSWMLVEDSMDSRSFFSIPVGGNKRCRAKQLRLETNRIFYNY